jgi:tetratricopeptide (TPR) repeat protein
MPLRGQRCLVVTDGFYEWTVCRSSSRRTIGRSGWVRNRRAKDFLDRYHAAYALIYDKGDFEGGITALRAMGYDDNADVATLLGYASRKLGRYDDAKYWYDKALAADPNHALTWSYYGMLETPIIVVLVLLAIVAVLWWIYR